MSALTEVERECLRLLAQGNRASSMITAIKYYRTGARVSLREAKDRVEALAAKQLTRGLAADSDRFVGLDENHDAIDRGLALQRISHDREDVFEDYGGAPAASAQAPTSGWTPDRATIRAVLDLFLVEGCDFHFNEANNYATIDMTLFPGEGDAAQYRGEPIMAQYGTRDGGTETRASGYYKLSDTLIDRIEEMIRERSLRPSTGDEGVTA